MTPFGEKILKHKMLLEELTNKYYGKLIHVSTAIEVASRAMNFQTAYDFESCLAVMQEAFNVNDGYFVDSASVVPVVRCKDCRFYTSMRPDIKTGICDLNVHHMGDDGFCSDGKRREE